MASYLVLHIIIYLIKIVIFLKLKIHIKILTLSKWHGGYGSYIHVNSAGIYIRAAHAIFVVSLKHAYTIASLFYLHMYMNCH